MLSLPSFKYSLMEVDRVHSAKASLREVRISHKHAVEVAGFIKGLTIPEARERLEGVLRMETPLPFRRHRKKVPHRRGLSGNPSGRYPVKTARFFLRLLSQLEANAEFKGLSTDRMRITGVVVHRGRKLKRYMPRAFGRASPRFETLTHVEMLAVEESTG
ncbi:MAG: 50S ribosomal protein L22 [Thermoproteota archaeon]